MALRQGQTGNWKYQKDVPTTRGLMTGRIEGWTVRNSLKIRQSKLYSHVCIKSQLTLGTRAARGLLTGRSRIFLPLQRSYRILCNEKIQFAIKINKPWHFPMSHGGHLGFSTLSQKYQCQPEICQIIHLDMHLAI